MTTDTDFVAIVRGFWGEDCPAWLVRLAEECNLSSQSRVAKRLGVSGSMLSAVMRARYGGNVEALRERVEGILMDGTVPCPGLGTIRTHECAGWRRKARAFSATNTTRVRMFKACHACPRFRDEEGA